MAGVNVSVIEQTGQPWLGKVQSTSFVRMVGYMVSDKRVPFPPSSLFLVSRDVLRFPDQPKVRRPNNEGSSRMGDEGCPNESPSVDDATGYSKEEEEATSVSCESSYDSKLGEHSAIENRSGNPHLETDRDRPPAHVASEKTSRCLWS